MSPIAFEITGRDGVSAARTGILRTPHGEAPTPAFMPVGTRGVVKALTPSELRAAGTAIILGNTYHLMLRPGEELVAAMGGLQRFTAWNGPILTDSGGFQVFSLAALRRVAEEGVSFRSHLDGSAHLLTPERSIAVQEALGSDIMMAFDECPEQPSTREQNAQAAARTTRWAGRSLAARRGDSALFGIVQGGIFEDLRAAHAVEITALPFDGFAIGGVSVGESREDVSRIVSFTARRLPETRPRYVMGMGRPEDLVALAGDGIDLFDCVLPTRNARNGQLFTWKGPLNIKRLDFEKDPGPIDPECGCATCSTFTRAYLRYLFRIGDRLAARLLSLHNIHFYQSLMARLRDAIRRGEYAAFRDAVVPRIGAGAGDARSAAGTFDV